MGTGGFVISLPFWALSLIIFLIVFLSIEAGWRLGNMIQRGDRTDRKTSISLIVGATLGLLSFLLAFTFGMAADRYSTRKSIIVNQANAIGTAYLRTNFLADPLKSESRQLLHDYLAICVGGAASVLSPQEIAKRAVIQDRLWNIGTGAIQQSNTVAVGLYMQSLNEMFDLDTSRIAANRNTLPDSIWLMLAVVTVFSMISLGYEFGLQGARKWIAIVLLIVAFTSVTILIADLDRPQLGLILISQQPLIDLLNTISSAAP